MYNKIIWTILLLSSILSGANFNATKEVFSTNEKIVISFSELNSQNRDWIGVYKAGDSNDWANVLFWSWTNDKASNSITFETLAVGEYEVRVFYNNSYKVEASKKFRVENDVVTSSVRTDKEVYSAGEIVEATFSNMSGSEEDWIAIYPKGSDTDWANVVRWKWIKGIRNGTETFNDLAVGEYEVRVFFNNSYIIKGKQSFNVVGNHSTSVKTQKETYLANEKIEVTFSNMSGSEEDWIAIYPEGSNTDWANVIRWKWIKGIRNGTEVFNSLPTGNYEVHVFFNNGYKSESSHKFVVHDGEAIANRKDFQLFGDTELNRIVGMQMSTMKQVVDLPLNGDLIYSSDIVNDNLSYGYGRATNKIFIIKRDLKGNFSQDGSIDLPFAPRTGSKNRKYGLSLITGSEKPMYAIIDTTSHTVLATGGRNKVTIHDDGNHGSSWATGHGNWLTDTHFTLPDREARELILYEFNPATSKVTELNRINTSSSIHVVNGELNNAAGIYYAIAEGSDVSRPEILELKFNGNSLKIQRTVAMPGTDLVEMTAHHAKSLADGKHIYMGTSDGFLHIIDKIEMKVVKTIEAGKGAGHTTLVPALNLGLVTNHDDQFVTVINTETHTKIKDIYVSGPSIKDTALQSHTARVSPDSKYYYNFATDNGYYYRINLSTLTMDKTTYTGGTPKQASQPGEVD